jgi:hypothetical protein
MIKENWPGIFLWMHVSYCKKSMKALKIRFEVIFKYIYYIQIVFQD